MVHGRFQPFHLGHLEYLRGAAARCDRLLVGITSPDRASRRPEPADPLRHEAAANPFTYTDRLRIVMAVLAAEGLHDALVLPFPVSEPALWPDYVPAEAVHFLRVFDAWGDEKVARLRAAGHDVVVLDPGARKTISGTEVRRRLFAGDPSWAELVPPAAVPVVTAILARHASDLRRPA